MFNLPRQLLVLAKKLLRRERNQYYWFFDKRCIYDRNIGVLRPVVTSLFLCEEALVGVDSQGGGLTESFVPSRGHSRKAELTSSVYYVRLTHEGGGELQLPNPIRTSKGHLISKGIASQSSP